MLKEKGVLFILVKEGRGEANVAEKLSSYAVRHFTYFMSDELKMFLKNAGFIVEDIYSWNEKDRRSDHRDLIWISSFSKKK